MDEPSEPFRTAFTDSEHVREEMTEMNHLNLLKHSACMSAYTDICERELEFLSRIVFYT
jgi:hypothetical protein